MQIHGTGNGFWPLDEARETAPGSAAPVPAARHLELGARLNGCFGSEESGAGLPPGFSMRRWSGCVPGSDLGFLLHEEGDALPAAVFEVALDWFAPPRSAATPKAPRAGAGFRKAGEGFGGIGKRPPGD
jgi:hypothetical protein